MSIFIFHFNNFATAAIHKTIFLHRSWLAPVRVHGSCLLLSGRANGKEEQNVMFFEFVPLCPDISAKEASVEHDICSDRSRFDFPDVRFFYLDNSELRNWNSHPGPPCEYYVAVVILTSTYTPEYVCEIFPDFVSRFKSEEVEISQKIVVSRQKLKVELRESESLLSRVVKHRDLRIVPQHGFCGVQRHLVDRLALALPPFVALQDHVREEAEVVRHRVHLVDEAELLGGEVPQLLPRELPQLLRQEPLVRDLAAVGERQLPQRLDELEAEALQLRDPLAVPERHLLVRQRLPGVVVDLKVHVEFEEVHELRKQLPLRQADQLGVLDLDEDRAVLEKCPREAPGRELAEEVDKPLHKPLAEQQPGPRARLFAFLGSLRHKLQLLEEVVHHLGDEGDLRALRDWNMGIPLFLRCLGLLLGEVLPVLGKARLALQLDLQPPLGEVVPQREAHETQDLAADHVLLKRAEDVDAEEEVVQLVDRLHAPLRPEPEEALEEACKLPRVAPDAFPRRDTLPELLVHHHDDAHHMLPARALTVKIRPQEVLQILTDLKQLNPPRSRQRPALAPQLLVVNGLHHILIEWGRLGLLQRGIAPELRGCFAELVFVNLLQREVLSSSLGCRNLGLAAFLSFVSTNNG
mmetsp:Transcript_15961/g.37842  ORF Transcript_15961/g.37842 Transcript_15961/m.37842 type:complete len:635 (-) Transcript_15961:608-2512(-)